MKFLKFLNRPLPGWLVLMLFAAIPAGATAVLPFFASGTASFGPGGAIDFGNADASNVVASADPGWYNGSGGNLVATIPNTSVLNVFNCTNAGCSTNQKSFQVSQTNANFLVPVNAVPSGGASPGGPLPPCFVPAGTPCNTESHAVHGNLTATTTGVCANNSNCTLRAAGQTTALTGNAQFLAANLYDINCSTFTAAGFMVTTGYVISQQIGILTFYNSSGTAIPDGTGNAVGFYCWGI